MQRDQRASGPRPLGGVSGLPVADVRRRSSNGERDQPASQRRLSDGDGPTPIAAGHRSGSQADGLAELVTRPGAMDAAQRRWIMRPPPPWVRYRRRSDVTLSRAHRSGVEAATRSHRQIRCQRSPIAPEQITAQRPHGDGVVVTVAATTFSPPAHGKPEARQGTSNERGQLGLTTHLVDPGSAQAYAIELCRGLASGPADSISLTKGLLRHATTLSLDQFLDQEDLAIALNGLGPDAADGRRAFIDKRPPSFT